MRSFPAIEYSTGERGYHTNFCLEFPWPNDLPDGRAQLCQDKTANDINQG
jgi:hypothetical protein